VSAAKHTAGPWQIRRHQGRAQAAYTVSRRAPSGSREHFEQARDGQPMLYGLEQARAAFLKAARSAS
jgi:hypothetical protein